MVTGFEVAAVKSVVDALLSAFKKARTWKLKANAEQRLTEAIRELLLASPDLNKADAAIAAAKAAGIISEDLFLAEKMRSSIHHGPLYPRRSAKKKSVARKRAKKAAKKRVSK